MGLHSVSDFNAMFQHSLTRITMASDGDFESLATSDTAESSLNLALLEQFNDVSSL